MYIKKNVFQGAANELTGAVGVGIHKSLCSNIIEGVSAELGKSLSWCHLLNRCEYYSVMIWLKVKFLIASTTDCHFLSYPQRSII